MGKWALVLEGRGVGGPHRGWAEILPGDFVDVPGGGLLDTGMLDLAAVEAAGAGLGHGVSETARSAERAAICRVAMPFEVEEVGRLVSAGHPRLDEDELAGT